MSENTTTDTLQDLLVTGIPNDITLTEIVPKLPWRYGHLLRVLSNTWQRAYRSGMVYDARVRSQATEKFFLAVCEFLTSLGLPQTYAIYLYSQSGDSWYKLPRIPGFPAGLPYGCKCVPLNGKLYVLGGSKNPLDDSGMREVYVLDLAGQESQWKQCQCMQVPRLRFGVSVMDGKIFVFGGASGGGMINRCEKYDPKVDVWSEIQPSLKYIFSDSNLYAVGKELFLFDANVDGGPFEGLNLLAGILRRDDPSDDEAEDPFVNEDDDPSDDEAEDPFVNEDDDPSDDEAEDPIFNEDDDPSDDEAEDLFISEHDSGDELHDGTWIKMIDPDLFRDDYSGNCQWFCEINKDGFHQIIEQEGLRNFDEAIENERLGRWDDLADATSYVAYDTGEDKWRKVKNLNKDDLNPIRLVAEPMQAPFSFGWEIRRNPLSFVETDLWPLNL